MADVARRAQSGAACGLVVCPRAIRWGACDAYRRACAQNICTR
jgi:hypothetical protein